MQWRWWPCPGPCIDISSGNDSSGSMTKTPQSITVIGAGITGLVAANYLALGGYVVLQVRLRASTEHNYGDPVTHDGNTHATGILLDNKTE